MCGWLTKRTRQREANGAPDPIRTHAHVSRLGLTLLLGAIAGVFAAGQAFGADITACGATIKTPGFYRVTQNLTATHGDCIDVDAAHTVVFLNGRQLKGSGSGVGVRFFPRAKFSFIEGGNSTLSGFAIGVEDDASNLRGDNFNANSNTNGGVLVNGAKDSTFSNFQASGNGSFGIDFVQGSNNVAEGAQAISNGGYGIWLHGSKDVRIDNFDVEQNGIAGVYVGCSSQGPGNACPGAKHISSANQIYDGFVDGNGPYGVVIDSGATANLITSVESMNNKTSDMLDLGKCGSDSWFGNIFANATPSNCIN